jgi:glycine hydroxymethyltransferase
MSPSENVTSPSLREIVASDFMHRYGVYDLQDIERRWEGNAYVIAVEKVVQDLAKRLFDVEIVDLKPISGHVAMLAAIGAFAKPGTSTFEVSEHNGGHGFSHFQENFSVANYRPEFYPFDTREWNIDVDAAAKKIRQIRPSALIFGSSFYLFPHPVKELRAVADEVGATVLCDEAHVLALIAGKKWPNPLSEGGHIFTGSTHKTFPGPQKGIVMTNNQRYAEKVARALSPGLQSNHHLMNVAALGFGMAEMLKYGKAYAKQVVSNARAFGASMAEEGFDVIGEHRGFTQSHQILIRTNRYVPAPQASRLLEKANIFANRMELQDANGLRTGTNELTRMGMKESNMKEVARFYRDVIIDRKDPRHVARRVTILMSDFGRIRYSFDSGKNPYKMPKFVN